MAVVSLRSNKRCCRPEKVYKPARQPARALFFLVSDMEAQSFEAGARVCANRHDARHVSHQRGGPEGERRHVMLAPQCRLRHRVT